MIKLKSFITSKLNILGILTMLISLQDFIKNYNFGDITWQGWITFAFGALIVVIRTFTAQVPVTQTAADSLQSKIASNQP